MCETEEYMVKTQGCEMIYLHPPNYTPKPRISLHVNAGKEVWKQVQWSPLPRE